MNATYKVISLFSGCGGLDLGFEQKNFSVIWANEYDSKIHATYTANFPHTVLNISDIKSLSASCVPNADGIIGGPPCQSWSIGGNQQGFNDPRGLLFKNYVQLVNDKKPKFFVAENVPGLITANAGHFALSQLQDYNIETHILDAVHFGVPQTRKRAFLIGFRKDCILSDSIAAPAPVLSPAATLRDAIWDLKDNVGDPSVPNHDFLKSGYSPRYLSRNRVRSWDEPSFTIPASGRHVPLHPQANKMIKISTDIFKFDERTIHLYRRLSVRECARIQTFPDSFVFDYENILDGYKMVGNAVPVNLAAAIADYVRQKISQ
jgi:DNA (cytosine-5)-methyltransferase 1